MPIRILDAATVGRISAGEVVERPTSVVKELVENALDAGATSITVEIKGGGVELLRVTDNGCGIAAGQVRLAFENHATSKLQSAEQLDDIRTLGFRGEALPSIAAVSHVEMRTRVKNAESGTQINIDGGENIRVREVGCPDGTTFIMRDLFYNIPVRRTFLKKASYEGGLVTDAVARLLIGNPNVAFRFINNDRTVYHSYGDGRLRHAVYAVYGKEQAEKMIEIDASEGATRIYGLIGVGELGKNSRAHQMFFINGRSVRCPLLTRALEQVCKSRVTIERYPMCALNLVLPPHAVDVNVHPNKLEVRFRDEEATRIVVEALLGTAFSGEKVLSFERDAAPRPELVRESRVRTVQPSLNELLVRERSRVGTVSPEAPAAPRLRESTALPWTSAPAEKPKTPEPVQPESTEKPKMPEPTKPEPVEKPKMPEPKPEPKEKPKMPELPNPNAPAPVEHSYRIIGAAFNTYILLEVDDSLLLIDQHAAHERLQYERYCALLDEGTASQQLLVPLLLRVSAREMALLRDNLDLLAEVGYGIEPFGATDIRVNAVPHILGKAQLRPVFMDLINSLSTLKQATRDTRRSEIMQMACKSAIKGGDRLTDGEIYALVDEMLCTEAPPTCPHGRPVVKRISRRDLEKMFRRI